MVTTASADSAVVTELKRLETERSRAISEQDWTALERLIADNYTHVHMPGRLESKSEYMTGVKGRPRKTERGDLNVRVYGDTAVITGVMTNSSPGSEPVNAMVSQTWVKNGNTWQVVSFQASRIAS